MSHLSVHCYKTEVNQETKFNLYNTYLFASLSVLTWSSSSCIFLDDAEVTEVWAIWVSAMEILKYTKQIQSSLS